MPSTRLGCSLRPIGLTIPYKALFIPVSFALAVPSCGGPDGEPGTPPGGEAPSDAAQSVDSTVVQLFLIALEDGGRRGPEIGCGDSLVPISRSVRRHPSVAGAALDALISLDRHISTDAHGQLYNALSRSSLHIDRVEVVGDTASVYLTGQLQLGGMCDTPRVKAQLQRTLVSAVAADHVIVYLGGASLDEALSAAG